MSRELANRYNMKHIWTRIFSVYGPYDNENTMIMNSIKMMLENKESPSYTKAEQMWDYIYSEDVAKAFYLLAEKGRDGQVYCIAQGKAQELKNYIEVIRDHIDKNIELKLGELPYSEKQVMNLSVDITKLKQDVGFTPTVTYEEGIERTIKWYKENVKNKKGRCKNEEN